MTRSLNARHVLVGCFSLIGTFLLICGGCGDGGLVPVEIGFGKIERQQVNELVGAVNKGIEEFKVRGPQAIDVFDKLPDRFKEKGADLIQFQLTEWGETMLGKGQVAVDCSARSLQERSRETLEMLKTALKEAVDEIDKIDKSGVSTRDKVSKWSVFLSKLKFKPVLLDPYICSFDHDVIQCQLSDATGEKVKIKVPSTETLMARGTGLLIPRSNPALEEKDRALTIQVFVVSKDKSQQARDISSCLRYVTDNTLAFAFNSLNDPIRPNDDYLEIRNKTDPKRQVCNQINIKIDDPALPATPPPSLRNRSYHRWENARG